MTMTMSLPFPDMRGYSKGVSLILYSHQPSIQPVSPPNAPRKYA